MPAFNVTLKQDAPEEELQKAKDHSKEQGGAITHEFSLIKGFMVEFAPDKVKTLETNDHIYVEQVGDVTTQTQ